MQVRSLVASGGGPTRNGVTHAASVRLHDDKASYTGAHCGVLGFRFRVRFRRAGCCSGAGLHWRLAAAHVRMCVCSAGLRRVHRHCSAVDVPQQAEAPCVVQSCRHCVPDEHVTPAVGEHCNDQQPTAETSKAPLDRSRWRPAARIGFAFSIDRQRAAIVGRPPAPNGTSFSFSTGIWCRTAIYISPNTALLQFLAAPTKNSSM